MPLTYSYSSSPSTAPVIREPSTQSCSVAMLTGLLAFWNFEEGAGALASSSAGSLHPIDLTLFRTSRSTGGNLTTAAGWTVEPSGAPPRSTYNGCGQVGGITAIDLSADGKACTLACRFWPGGGAIQGGSPVALPQQVVGLRGMHAANPTVEAGYSVFIQDPTAATGGALALRVWNGVGANELPLTTWGITPVPGAPQLIVVTLERLGTQVLAAAYLNGVPAGTASVPFDFVDVSGLTFGDAEFSDGSVSQAAAWNIKLSFQEITGFARSLDCLIPAAPPSEPPPLLNPDGTTAIHPEWPVPLDHAPPAGQVLVSEGRGGRHTRRAHERNRRTYGLRIRLGSGREVALLKAVLEQTRMGCLPTRWRHPKDDPPGPPETAPRYLIVNALEGSMAVQRAAGGAIGDFTLVLRDL